MDLDVEHLIGQVIRGTLSASGKRNRGAMRYLTGGRGSLLSGSTLLALAGVAWGLYESAQGTAAGTPGTAGGEAAAAAPAPTAVAGATPVVPPPVPGAPPAASSTAGTPVQPALARVLQLVVSAAKADGSLSPAEERAILAHSRAAGTDAEAIVARELASTRPLAEIVGGVTDGAQREDLYTLAFAIVRADETVTGAERIYLAQLAYALGLDAASAARLEQAAAARIDEAVTAGTGDGGPAH